MSAWLRLVNDIKRTASEDYLTPQQRSVWQSLCTVLELPQRINLYGPSGSGKTFVAWMVARSMGAVHVPLPSTLESIEPGTEILLVDNAPTSESAVRTLWAQCNLLNIRSIVVITQHPVAIPTRAMVLPLPVEEDWVVVNRTLMRLGYFPPYDQQAASNFWSYLHHCVEVNSHEP